MGDKIQISFSISGILAHLHNSVAVLLWVVIPQYFVDFLKIEKVYLPRKMKIEKVYLSQKSLDRLHLLGWPQPAWGNYKSMSMIQPLVLCTIPTSFALSGTCSTCKRFLYQLIFNDKSPKQWFRFNDWQKVLFYQFTLLRKLHSSGARWRPQAALETSFELRSMLYFLQVSITWIQIVTMYLHYTALWVRINVKKGLAKYLPHPSFSWCGITSDENIWRKNLFHFNFH